MTGIWSDTEVLLPPSEVAITNNCAFRSEIRCLHKGSHLFENTVFVSEGFNLIRWLDS